MKTLRGKFLIKKNKLQDGRPCLTLTGICLPKDFDIDSVSDGDEMWICDLMVLDGGLRYSDAEVGDVGSPEEFLAGAGQKESTWKTKTNL